jgi:hypothetical protein
MKVADIIIDGDHADWNDHLSLIEKHDVSVGVQHDDEDLYLCLVTTDRQIQNQVLRMGLTIWLSPEGGKKKQFGIHYPIGLMGSGMPIREIMPSRSPDAEDQSYDRMEELIIRSLFELEILGPEKEDVERMHVNQALGLEVKVGRAGGLMVYELKVPRIRDENHPYGLDTTMNESWVCGFETGEIEFNQMQSGMGSRMGGGMRGGGRGRMGGGRGRGGGGPPVGGMRGGGMMERPEPVRIWTRILVEHESGV